MVRNIVSNGMHKKRQHPTQMATALLSSRLGHWFIHFPVSGPPIFMSLATTLESVLIQGIHKLSYRKCMVLGT